MNITVKSLSDDAYKVIKNSARDKGRSVNAYLVQLIEDHAYELQRRKKLLKGLKRLDDFSASLPPMPDSVPLIREDRER